MRLTGDTEDRYIVGGAGGDQMCGRLLAGNDPSTAEFAVLPPHFSPEGMQEIQAIGWDKFIKSFNELPRGFRNCIPFFLASILYHLPTLQAWFPDPQHSIWEIPLFGMFGQDTMSRLNQLRDKVVLKVHSCQECGMLAHGIPTKTDIIHTIKELVTKVSKIEGMFTMNKTLKKNPKQTRQGFTRFWMKLHSREENMKQECSHLVDANEKDYRDELCRCE